MLFLRTRCALRAEITIAQGTKLGKRPTHYLSEQVRLPCGDGVSWQTLLIEAHKHYHGWPSIGLVDDLSLDEIAVAIFGQAQ